MSNRLKFESNEKRGTQPRSAAMPSELSTTDVKLFVALANPEITDTTREVEHVIQSARRAHAAEALSAIPESAFPPPPSPPAFDVELRALPVTEARPMRPLDDGRSSDGSQADEVEEVDEDEVDEVCEAGKAGETDEEADEKAAEGEDDQMSLAGSSASDLSTPETESSQGSTTRGRARAQPAYTPATESSQGSITHGSGLPAYTPLPLPVSTGPGYPLSKDELEELALEKQSVLLELGRLEMKGITLTRRYTMNDRVEDMQFEVRRHLLNQEEQRAVQFMRDSMRLLFSGIEIANGKLGPFLDLDGWAAEVGSDIDRYDPSLSKLYRKYWRRSSMSPEMELTVGILGSMGMHHFKRKFASSIVSGAGGGGGGLGGLAGLAGLAGMGGGAASGGARAAAPGARAGGRAKPPPPPPDSDEEGLPETFR